MKKLSALLLAFVLIIYACDTLVEDDVIPENLLDESTVLSGDELLALKESPIIINVVDQTLENTSVTLKSQSDKAEIKWLSETLLQYTAYKEASGKDHLIFDISTDSKQYTDSITVVIGEDDLDSCMVIARNDYAVIGSASVVNIPILANDVLCEYTLVSASIAVSPNFGSALLSPNNTLTYITDTPLTQNDGLVYRLDLEKNEADSVSHKSIYGLAQIFIDNPTDTTDSTSCTVKLIEDFFQTSVNEPININPVENDSIQCADSITFFNFGSPLNGTVNQSGETSLLYTPNSDFTGIDSLYYELGFTNGESYSASISIEVLANEIPQDSTGCDSLMVFDDYFEYDSIGFNNQLLDVTLNDNLCDSMSAELAITKQPSFGSASVQNLMIQYIPDSVAWQSISSDTLRYEICYEFDCLEGSVIITK